MRLTARSRHLHGQRHHVAVAGCVSAFLAILAIGPENEGLFLGFGFLVFGEPIGVQPVIIPAVVEFHQHVPVVVGFETVDGYSAHGSDSGNSHTFGIHTDFLRFPETVHGSENPVILTTLDLSGQSLAEASQDGLSFMSFASKCNELLLFETHPETPRRSQRRSRRRPWYSLNFQVTDCTPSLFATIRGPVA